MDLSTHALPSVVLSLAIMAGLTAGSCLLCSAHRDAKQALAVLDKIKAECAALGRQTPTPDKENEQVIERDLQEAEKTLAALQSVIVSSAGTDDDVPAVGPTRAYFEIAAFGEHLRTAAAASHIVLKPGEHFGFASYSREGPAVELLPVVVRQRGVLQTLVEALIEARPQALLSVQRQNPAETIRPGQPARSGPVKAMPAGGVAEDFFDFDPQLALPIPEHLTGRAYRFEFTGQTRVLRAFLKTLAAGPLPVFVRSVEVSQLAASSAASPPASADDLTPIVPRNISRFVVVVEALERTASSAPSNS